MSEITAVSVKTIRWQCSGCDHLCGMLMDGLIGPKNVIVCLKGKWRKVKL